MGFQVAEVGLISLAVMLSMLTGASTCRSCRSPRWRRSSPPSSSRPIDAASRRREDGSARDRRLHLVGLLAGTACGVINGLLITRVRITPILATLGTMQLLNGLAIVWTKGQAVYGMPDPFLTLATGTSPASRSSCSSSSGPRS